MLQFKPYRVFTVHSEHAQKKAKYAVDSAFRAAAAETNPKAKAKDYDEAFALQTAALKETDTNPIWKEEVTVYEREIYRMLQLLHGNPVGQLVFRLRDPQTEVWVVSWIREKFYNPPANRTIASDTGCSCAITQTFRFQVNPSVDVTRMVGKDTYILFSPTGGFTEDFLLHELVHSYRMSRGKFDNFYVFKSKEYNIEEFLAMIIQNMYLSSLGKPLYYTYNAGFDSEYPDVYAAKEQIYNHFITDQDIILGIAHLLDHDEIARTLKTFDVAFNPFRDYQMLFRRYFEKSMKALNMGF